MKYNPTALSTDLWPLNMAKPRLYVLLCIELIILLGLSLQLTLPADWLAISKASQLASALSGLVGSATDWVRHRPSVDWLPEQPLLTSLLHTGRWAELSVIALFGLLISSTYIHHRSSKKQMDDIRNQIAADLHDEIGSSLSSIGLLGALARNGLSDPHKSACLLNQLVEETRQVSNALDDVVWSVSPRDEQSAYLGARIYRYAANLFETAGIAYQINMPDESVLTQVPTAQQRDLYFFVKGVVSNIIKHAGATSASLTLLPQKGGLQLTITDNGRGFDPALGTLRNGLRNLTLRSTALRGRSTIQSAVKQGTTIGLWFPLPTRS